MQISILLFHKLKKKKSSFLKAQCFTSTFLLLHILNFHLLSPMSHDKNQLYSISIKSPFHLKGCDLDISFPKGKTYLLHAGWVVPVISSNMGKFTAVSVVVGNCICASPWKFKMSIKSPLVPGTLGKSMRTGRNSMEPYFNTSPVIS